jgi:undecaprenyl diphosphate synthase
MLNLFLYIYEWILKKAVLKSSIILNHILLVIDETDLFVDAGDGRLLGPKLEKLAHFVKWCHGLGINIVSVYVSVIGEGKGEDKKLPKVLYSRLVEGVARTLDNQKEKATIEIYAPGGVRLIKGNDDKRRINVSIGLGGKNELTKAIKEIAYQIKMGEIAPEDIDDKIIESALIFKTEPDLIIRSGATRLTDFLIWQSVYSEFYFTDVNWANFRKIDLLRAIRDFQWRERRFGG